MLEDRCVACGIYIPEGMMICPLCEEQIYKPSRKTKEDLQEDKQNILEFLKNGHRGKDNAVFSRELEELFGIGDRDVRRHISSLRKDGIPICSDSHKGYYYADSQEDINKTIGSLNDFVSSFLGAISGLRTSRVNDAKGFKITITIEPDDETDAGIPEPAV